MNKIEYKLEDKYSEQIPLYYPNQKYHILVVNVPFTLYKLFTTVLFIYSTTVKVK